MAWSSSMLRMLRGAWRGARELPSSSSFSSTLQRHKTGVHLHRIESYSEVVGQSVLPGRSVPSAPFCVGGNVWQLHYYPDAAGKVSVTLELRGAPWWRPLYLSPKATAAYKVSILDGDGNMAFSGAKGPHQFSRRHWLDSCCSSVDVVKADELRSALRSWEDDVLVVRCDITVMKP